MNFMEYLIMKYNELPQTGTDLQLHPSFTTELLPSCRQAQASGGEPRDLKPNILFEFNCAGALGLLLSVFAVTLIS